MVNNYYSYKNIDLWDSEMWRSKQSPVGGLIQWIGDHDQKLSIANNSKYPPIVPNTDLTRFPNYKYKTSSMENLELIKVWADSGMFFESREMGAVLWIPVLPLKALGQREKKLPVLLVMQTIDYSDPYWAMKLMEHYQAYNEVAAREDRMIVYIATNGPDKERMYVNILQEALVLYPGDPGRVYLDVSKVCSSGTHLKDIPDFVYTDKAGQSADPDAAVKYFGSAKIPVLDITKRWENNDSMSRYLIMRYKDDKKFDFERLLHSNTGMKIAEAMALEYSFNTIYDSGFNEYWSKMGLRFEKHETGGERWATVVPMSAPDQSVEKLPVVLILQEVYYSNEHLAVSAMSYFYEYQNIAANGDAIILYFALENPDSNDLLCKILDEATKLYPIDRSRVYITGHSHNGHYSIEFARRHPDIITAVATLGNSSGLESPEVCHDAVVTGDEKINLMSTFDMPLINISGCCEDWEKVMPEIHINSWQRRLKASGCPMKTAEEIEAAFHSEDKATRMLGIPNDKSETLYAEGFEHYIGDVRNNYGKYHLRIVKIENMPHVVTPFMLSLSWSFMSRFARDQKNGEIIDLY